MWWYFSYNTHLSFWWSVNKSIRLLNGNNAKTNERSEREKKCWLTFRRVESLAPSINLRLIRFICLFSFFKCTSFSLLQQAVKLNVNIFRIRSGVFDRRAAKSFLLINKSLHKICDSMLWLSSLSVEVVINYSMSQCSFYILIACTIVVAEIFRWKINRMHEATKRKRYLLGACDTFEPPS